MTEAERRPGYNGRILKLDLTSGSAEVERPPVGFYRTYLGGGLLGAYYVHTGVPQGADALSPQNVLVFAPSVTTGAPVAGASRFSVSAKSPLSGGMGDAQCGGAWGPRLKHAGFDAVVVTGRAETPTYLWIHDGEHELRDATPLLGLPTGEVQAAIRREIGEPTAEVAQCGPAGERLVRFACVTGGLSHFAGRCGMGAVMGSKRLRAVVVSGRRTYEHHDEAAVKALARAASGRFRQNAGLQMFQQYGTSLGVEGNAGVGNIVTRNFQSGEFAGIESLNHEALKVVCKGNDTCWGCPIRCKRVVQTAEPLVVDPAYGGPEFETLIMLGSNLGVGDIACVTKASELVNKLGLDSVATGSMIGFAMECFERGVISERQTGGLELRFGRGDVVLELIEMIASRRGLGDVLADGYPRAIAEWGGAAAAFAVQVKNQGFPAHMARVKKSQAIGYAVCPIGPDHMASEHDWLAAADGDVPRGLGLTVFTDWPSFDRAKVRASLFSQFYMSLLDSLTLCMFPWGLGSLLGPRDLEDLVFACTGWRVTFWELMKAGERRLNLMRAFNAREGLGRDDDALPPRVFEPLQGGPADGARVDPRVFAEALEGFYAMAGWAPETGAPTAGKLIELGLDAFVPHERSHGG